MVQQSASHRRGRRAREPGYLGMSANKPPKLSVEACQRLWASVAINKNLSSEQQSELLGQVASIWPGRRRSILQEWAYPEIHRLVNGVGTLPNLPPGKRFEVKSASRMVAKVVYKLAEKPTEKQQRNCAWGISDGCASPPTCATTV